GSARQAAGTGRRSGAPPVGKRGLTREASGRSRCVRQGTPRAVSLSERKTLDPLSRRGPRDSPLAPGRRSGMGSSCSFSPAGGSGKAPDTKQEETCATQTRTPAGRGGGDDISR